MLEKLGKALQVLSVYSDDIAAEEYGVISFKLRDGVTLEDIPNKVREYLDSAFITNQEEGLEQPDRLYLYV